MYEFIFHHPPIVVRNEHFFPRYWYRYVSFVLLTQLLLDSVSVLYFNFLVTESMPTFNN